VRKSPEVEESGLGGKEVGRRLMRKADDRDQFTYNQ